MPESSAQGIKRTVYDNTISGAQDRPHIPRLRSDPPSYHPLPQSLIEFRAQEGREYRKARLRALWKQLLTVLDAEDADTNSNLTSCPVRGAALTPESARQMRKIYDRELMGSCKSAGHIGWKQFKKYAEDKEAGQSVSPTPLAPKLCACGSMDVIKSSGISSMTN
jgi:solute carrier family 25 (mitochondrial phosphate transporter), member 23/24/25/41